MAVDLNSVRGALLGTAVGDALGMPIEGLSHQNVRTYYKGIKGYRADDQRDDLEAGQWTDDTQMTFAVVRALSKNDSPSEWPEQVAQEYLNLRSEARRWGPTTSKAVRQLASGVPPSESGCGDRPTNGAAMRVAPLALWWAVTDATRAEAFNVIQSVLAVTHRHPAALAAAWGQAVAVRTLLRSTPDGLDRRSFWERLLRATTWAEGRLGDDTRVSDRLRQLDGQVDSFPLDLRDVCNSVGVRADEAWPFAAAMGVRRPHLLENTLLSGINVGGDADTTGAMMGAQLGALHGWTAFPQEWRTELERVDSLSEQVEAFIGQYATS